MLFELPICCTIAMSCRASALDGAGGGAGRNCAASFNANGVTEPQCENSAGVKSGGVGRYAPAVVPGIPGSPGADRLSLITRLEKSQRAIERTARAILGHELEPCPLEHPLVGRLRCGEWLLFAGVHDLMHLEQLHEIRGRVGEKQ